MTGKKQTTKRAPQPKGYSWGATQPAAVKSGEVVSINSPKDSASGVAS